LFQQYGRFAETVNAFLKWIRFCAVFNATFGWFFFAPDWFLPIDSSRLLSNRYFK
jgi:hypothetical protein